MIRTLSFDENNVPVKLDESIPSDINETVKTKQRWISLRAHDDVRRILPSIVMRTQSFVDDLLEEQRPRIQEYSTLEENDETYKVIIVKLPTIKILETDDFQLQVSFMIVGKTLISITNRDHHLFHQIMSKLILRKKSMEINQVIGFILEELADNSIMVSAEIEDEIERMEQNELKGRIRAKGFLSRVTDLKGRLFEGIKDSRADLEVAREIIGDPDMTDVIFEHVEDRVLYLIDQLESQRSSINDLVNIHISMASHIMNQRLYNLTIIGSLMVIPTIISGLFGMNVELPPLTFNQILLFILVNMVISYLLIRVIFRIDRVE